MHLSNKQRLMNKTFTVLTNKYCSIDNDVEQDQTNDLLENLPQLSLTSEKNRFCTFTKYKIKEQSTIVSVNQNQQRYFDSPTMITLDDDDENEIPISRCSNKTSINNAPASESVLNETDLSDLFVFTNPNRLLNESMQVVMSRHPSLHDLKYINDASSVLITPLLNSQNKEEPIYQELMQIDQLIPTPPKDYADDVDEDKENRPPLMPILCPRSRIPVWTPSPPKVQLNNSIIISKSKKQEGIKKKSTTKPCLTELLDEWSFMTPKLKELLSNTSKLPLRIPQLTSNTVDFRRLKQLLNDMEMTSSSWTNAINQCRYILRHAQQKFHH